MPLTNEQLEQAIKFAIKHELFDVLEHLMAEYNERNA